MSESIAIHILPKPVTISTSNLLSLYKYVRLAALLTNPEAFGSTYARETAFSDDAWAERVNERGRETLLALFHGSETHTATPSAPRENDKKETAIGTLTVLFPIMLAGHPQDPAYPPHIAEEVRACEVDVYMLVGMWVHPAHRGRGVGKALVQRAMEVVEQAKLEGNEQCEEASGINESCDTVQEKDKKQKKKVLMLLVHDIQYDAIRLYRNTGFVEQGSVLHGGKAATWMTVTI
ncbi:hypothetical protein JR316_0010305 [Psilocybe cubensis]|uniref:Uncharacterized protein n=2 Tax=Psilocybe cubensis TaxID=181762 RepID=A0ACB8GQQ4_PSICU|nr:hypothetical protein JR316_0010305 [Psilocybe cubensis]KAH9478068.1 hypothetical protein JR316_0010305 [Psilocybe cubensis]